jgi:hypothetical protein
MSHAVQTIRRVLTAGMVVALGPRAWSAEAPANMGAAWRLGARAQFNDAEAAMPADATGDDAEFTRAVLRFSRQPRTAANMDAAVAILSKLAARAATPALRARSLYFWARAEELRETDARTGVVRSLYERLRREYPHEPFGQRALVHELLREFYSDDRRETVLARCAALERLAEGLTDSVVRGHFHQVAARGYLQLGGAEALALKHLLAAEKLGAARREARGDWQVSIGQLAAELGQPGLAREHYAAFLREFPRDPRAFTVNTLLTALPPGEKSPP